jgi:PAS domain S-box-containing protein
MTPAVKDARKPRSLRVPILALTFFAVAAAVIVGIAYRYHRAQKEAIEHEVRNQLLSIADLKVKEISDWLAQRMDEVGLLMADRATARVMQRIASGAGEQSDRAEIQTWLNEICLRLHYANATFVDARGNPVLSAGSGFTDPVHLRQVAGEVLRTNRIYFHDLQAGGLANAVHLGLNFPLQATPGGQPFGAVLFSINPAEHLYPLLRTWPFESQTGDTLLVRREGDEAVYLNDTRFHPDAALRLRIPLSRGDSPAVKAVLGAHGIVEGTGIRGVPVIAAVRAVPDMPWSLAAKMDVEEVEGPIRRRSLLLILATASLILAVGAAIFALWRRQQLEFNKADVERQALIGHYDYLSRFANDIILLVDDRGRILEANDRAVSSYGFSREELRQKTVRDLLHASDRNDFERLWKEIGEQGSMVFEGVHRRRDGRPFPVEVSVRFIHVGESQFRQSIIRDITERKILDEKLRRALDAHTAVIESSASAIVTSTPDFRVASWNKAAERIFGWTAEEAVGGPPLFVPAHRLESAKDIHQRAMSGEVISGMRGLGLCKDGRTIPLSISAAGWHDPDGRPAGVVMNFLDTTEQTMAEEALRRNEALYRATFDQAAVGMDYVSIDGRYLRVNPRYCELVGYSQEELLRLRFQDITHPDDWKGEKERLEALLSGKSSTTSYNKRYIRKDGALVWLHLKVSLLRSESGEPLHFVGVVEDVTERLHAEEALRQSEERFRRVVESAPEGILVERDTCILYANSTAISLFGASASELIGRSLLDLARPEDREEIRGRSALSGSGTAVPPTERILMRMDGTPFPVEVSATPIEFDRQPASLVFLRDIKERKQAEAEKRQLEEQLLQVQKMESLGRLAGGVAHDFNNHLTVIAGYCDMLLAGLKPGLGREEVEEIRAAGQRAGTLTQQLLAFGRKQIAEPKPLDLNEVVAESGKMLGRLIGEQIQIVTSLDPGLGLVVADRGQMVQILMNLVINARDAMPSGGRILLEARNVDVDENSRLSKERAPGGYVLLSVADTGAGMSEEVLKHIFEPFFTTKGMGLGTGLGLSTVYGTVKQSGGWIRAESRVGEGSRFLIYLPRVDGAAVVAERPAAPLEVTGGEETVLVAEDQPEVRRLALRILNANGYRLLEASSGPEALELSRRHTGPIDLLLTDVVMPEMTGRELASRLRESRPGIKVLYVSGYAADIIGHEGVLDQGVDYLPKPFTPAQLAAKVRDVLGQSKTMGRILVVDDDDAVRGVLQKTLSDAGYEVLTARDGREAMRLVATHPFDLVLTDLIMPDQEGIETIRELHRDYPSIRIVAMSGAMDAVYLRTAELLGAGAALPKPINGSELLRTIRDLLT